MSEIERLEHGLAAGQWVPLSPEADAAPMDLLPPGPGVLVRSGGSSGGSRCASRRCIWTVRQQPPPTG